MFAPVEAFFRNLRRRLSHREWAARRRRSTGSKGEEPGLLLIQIDGLSRLQLERAIDRRRMPFLRRLVRHEGSRLHDFYPGLPSTTAAVPPGEDVILCGDFNASPGSPAYRLAAQRLRDAQAGLKGHTPLRTFNSTQPFARIDHIFTSPAFVPERIRVPRDRLTRVASDHFPLVVDFAIGPATVETPGRKPA